MSKESKALAKVDTSTLTIDQVPDLLQRVNDKISEIQEVTKSTSSVGSGEIPGIGFISEMSIPQLIATRSSIRKQEAAYDEEVQILKKEGVHITKKDTVKMIGEYPTAQWIESIAAQINKTGKQDLLQKLMTTKNKLTKYVTKEQQLRSDMGDIAELLS